LTARWYQIFPKFKISPSRIISRLVEIGLAVIVVLLAFGTYIVFRLLQSPPGLIFVIVIIVAMVVLYVLRKRRQKSQKRAWLVQQQQQAVWYHYQQQEAASLQYARRVWEQQERERQDRERISRMKSLGDILVLTPKEFEKLTGRILENNGVLNVQHTGKSGDLGADLIGVDINGNQIIIQCKRYAPGNTIGSPEIQKFIGMMNVHHKAQKGIFVTTTTYTRPAINFAAQHNITLIDGNKLIELLQGVH
jgi:restriction endonuclease Mrr